jgi:DNA polymerase-3 subunit alpha
MTKFAEYGFNKSHTAAYAVVTYHTAWLKAHHCAAFMAATMSSDMDNTDSVKIFYEDTIANKVKVLGPDVNASEYRFEPVDRSTIRYGLGAVKGTGEQAVNVILKAREAGGRSRICSISASVRQAHGQSPHHRGADRAGAFEGAAAEEHAPHYVEVPRWSEKQQLTEEKTALGFFFSGHPYNAVRAEVSRFVRRSLDKLEPQRDLQLMAGLVTTTRTKITGRGKMVFVTLDDGTTPQEVAIYSEVLEAERGKIREDEVLIIEGKVQKDDFAGEGKVRVTAERILTLAEARSRFARELRLSLNGQVSSDRNAAQRLKSLLSAYAPGACPVRISYRNGEAQCELNLGDSARVRLEDELLAALGEWLSSEAVEIRYQ